MMKQVERKRIQRHGMRLCALLLAGTMLAGCNALNRLAQGGDEPRMSEIKNPTHAPEYQPVSMPMPQPTVATPRPNCAHSPSQVLPCS